MNRFIVTFFVLATVAAAQGLLDQPIKGKTSAEVFSELRSIYQKLSKEDSAAFSMGVTGLTAQIKGWQKKEMTEIERDEYVFAVVRGMSPRQVIIVGSTLSALLYRVHYLEQKAASSVGDKSLAFLKSDAEGVESIAAQFVARYSKEANQASEPTAPSGRGSP